MLTLTDFLSKVEAGQVAEVEINGSNLKGEYTAGGTAKNSGPPFPRSTPESTTRS